MRNIMMAFCLWMSFAQPVAAADLESAKASGLLGEQIDGYLGLGRCQCAG